MVVAELAHELLDCEDVILDNNGQAFDRGKPMEAYRIYNELFLTDSDDPSRREPRKLDGIV